MKLLVLALAALIAGGSWAADPKASRYYEDALDRYEKKDLSGAIIQLKNALQIDKGMLQAQLLLGKALLQNSEVAAAEVALLEALRLGVNRAEVVPLLAQAYLAQGKHKLLFEQHHFSLTGLPPRVQLQLLLVRAAAQADLGNTREALHDIDAARAIDAQTAATWLAEIPVRIRARQFAEAGRALDRALALAPDSADAWQQKASLEHLTGSPKKALASYGRVLELDPGHVDARVARVGLLVDLGRHDAAAADVAVLVKHSPREPRAAYFRAMLAERQGKTEEVAQALRDITQLIDPVALDFIRYRPQLLMLNGLAHFGLNEYQKAREYLEAFEQVQRHTATSKLLAQIYLMDNRGEKAAELLEAYLKVHPRDGQAMILLGNVLQAQGRNARAISVMKQALETRDAPEYRTVLGIGLLRSGQAGAAIPELEAALKQNPGQAQAATALIGLYLRSGQARKAVGLAEDMLKRRPASADFYNLLGMARRQAGELPVARAAFEKAVSLDGQLLAPQLNLVRLDIAAGAFDAATSRLAPLLRAHEKNPEVWLESARLAEQRGQLPEAQRGFEKAVDSAAPKDPRWALALADFHQRQGHPVERLAAARQAVSRAPENLPALLALAAAQLANNDRPSARSTLTSATRIAGFNAPQLLEIALLQQAADHLDGAAFTLDKAVTARPDFMSAQALLAEIEMRQGEYAKADKRARELVTRYPKLAIGHSLLGDLAQAKQQSAAAVEAYRRAHTLEPTTETLLRLFHAQFAQDAAAALSLAEKWLKTHPKDVTVMRALGDGQARSAQFNLARKTYENVVMLAGDDAQSLNNLANVLFRLQDPGAQAVAERALARNPQDANVIDTLGWLLHHKGETDRALQLLRDARLRAPDNPEIRYHLAVSLAKAGRKQEARQELAEALAARMPFEDSQAARALAEQLEK